MNGGKDLLMQRHLYRAVDGVWRVLVAAREAIKVRVCANIPNINWYILESTTNDENDCIWKNRITIIFVMTYTPESRWFESPVDTSIAHDAQQMCGWECGCQLVLVPKVLP